MTDDAGVQAKVDQLAKGFLARLPARLDKIDEAFAACRAAPADREAWQELYRLLHSLGGAAGTFGVAAVGAEARRLELVIEHNIGKGQQGQDALEADEAPGWDAAQVDAIAAALGALRTMAAA